MLPIKKYIVYIFVISLLLASCGNADRKKPEEQGEEKIEKAVDAEVASPESITDSAIETKNQNTSDIKSDVKPTVTALPSAVPDLLGEAKRSYEKHMAGNKDKHINAFSLVDINQDGIPELIEGQIYYPDLECPQQQVFSIYGYVNNRIKKLTGKDFWHERGMTYLPEQNAVAMYDGGTSNSSSYYGIKNNKLKKKGTIGHLWYGAKALERRPNLNGRWISEKKYKKFFKDEIPFSLIENTKENRELYLRNKRTLRVGVGDKCRIPKFEMTETDTSYASLTQDIISINEEGRLVCLKEGKGEIEIKQVFPGRTERFVITLQVGKKFNEDGNCALVEMKIADIYDFGKKFLLTGKARTPVNALPTEKEIKQLKKGKLTLKGKTYRVEEEYIKDAEVTHYYLYEDTEKKEGTYKYALIDIPYLMNYPNPVLHDKKGRIVYDSVGEISVWIDENAFDDIYEGSMEYYFCHEKLWKNKWVPMDVEKNHVTRIMTE